ncbi:MAG: 4-hydroxy-2-oxovalerate aldolase [Candidatus Ryanbacteria bacterium CG10_big_fil_rev_8_21_14_0_10_43_42]|uniref:4-hydroxy-2-oxovalerate aldolase n=1 Tax=Candidatus Ryanbacteria bacterium CG10_big_fil_rev_8_21_14_0_10_43_42 TaxID=1974864 RepID=A0A2M8KXJ8_9BACT|nr:MAG: 4-hydroxy-2-oxovalerate aldolase [Candidatus Ryanbacteria bacterium CG10_big_fil_rev_8_21_14_0_10_43_42]
MKNPRFFDSTLRDGSHAVRHQISVATIKDYCEIIDGSGIYVVIVGHGNGLGASTLQVGRSLHSDSEIISTARDALHSTKLGVFMIPGFGTIKDDLAPALDAGVDLVCIGVHCTEADVTQQYVEYVNSRGKEAIGVLMMYHRASKERLLEEAQKMQQYGAHGVLLMDSAGSSTADLVRQTIEYLVRNLQIPVGFHGHNNLGMAVANSYYALKSGAAFIDGTTLGFGAGAGNCQLDALIALLQKNKIDVGVSLYKLLDAGEKTIKPIMVKPQGIDATSIVSGLAGVFSGFAPHVNRIAMEFGVDPRDIFVELGKRNVVAGQEDIIVDVAVELSNKK